MHNHRLAVARIFFVVAISAALLDAPAVAQPKSATSTQAVPSASNEDFSSTQEELIRLLRLSPTLTTVVARDPSLLADQSYVSRNNPQLSQFLESHPEVVRNPDFYLFTRSSRSGRRDEVLERAVWPEFSRGDERSESQQVVEGVIGPFLVFLFILGALLWLIHLFIENRRWTRIFKLQTEVHSKLIDRFGTNQELLTYMGTDAGKRFLEAAPIPVDLEHGQRVPSGVARILTPLQVGIVLTLLGLGFLLLRHASPDLDTPMLVMGTAILMPGIGFILSAGITWVMAGRLGLIPDKAPTSGPSTLPFDREGRQ